LRATGGSIQGIMTLYVTEGILLLPDNVALSGIINISLSAGQQVDYYLTLLP
jgi:hypothetical protein